jgi:raffinose/stachyose/melibiose transport system substrate-binding protein
MGRKKRIYVAIALGVAALTVGLSAASAKPKAQITLTLLGSTGGGQAATEIMVKNFERVYPNINIQDTYVDTATEMTLLLTQFQAGNAPDIFPLNPGGGTVIGIWPLATAGRLLDLTGRPWQKRIFPPALSEVSCCGNGKGKIYGWPAVLNPFATIYNNDLFKQLGLSVPKKFSDVLAMCRKIVAAGKIPFVQAFGNVADGSIVGRPSAAEFVYSADPSWNTKRAKGQVTFASSPLWKRAIQSIVDMKDAGCFQPGANGTSRAQKYALFATGQAVMTETVGSEIPNMTAITPSLKVTMFNLPPDDAKNAVGVAIPSTIWSGNAATAHPKEVRLFIDFLAREKQSSLFAKVAASIAPLDLKKGKLPDYMKQYMGPLFATGKAYGDFESTWPLGVFEAYRQGILGLFTGQTTVDSILANMDTVWGPAK